MAHKRRLVLVDASALIFRAYFAIPTSFHTKDGLHTNAIYGFAMMFKKLFAGRRPDLAAVVFDAPGRTFREAKFPAYKAMRPPIPSELAEQLPVVDELVSLFRFARLRLEGYEADDVIGTLTTRALAAGLEVLIVSPDKDFCQLVCDDVKMLDTLRDVTYDAELVRKKFGVAPAQIVDLFALMGDAVDNIPGVSGIGQKGAAALLERYGTLDALLAHTDELKERQRAALTAERDVALLSRELARIVCDAPIDVDLEALAVPDPAQAELDALYRRLEFFSLLEGEAGVRERATTPVRVVGGDEAAALLGALAEAAVFPVFAPVAGRPPSPAARSWLGVALAARAGEALYISFDDATARAAVLAWLADPTRGKITHNLKELWQLCHQAGVALAGVSTDLMLASFLVEPTKLVPHRLDQLAREYNQILLSPLKDLVGSGQKEKPLASVPPLELATWAAQHVEAIVSLREPVLSRLDALGMSHLLKTHEMPLAVVLGRMELDGVRVDAAELDAVEADLKTQLAEREARIYALAGRKFNIGSTKQLATVLFEELKLPVIKRNKTGYSTDSEVLERLAPKHEIAGELVEQRKLAKLINTYTEVLRAAIDPADARVHATFQQTTGVSGRLISTDPDLQRTPIRTPEGKRIRRAFIADAGHVLISADWSQIELRVLAHVSGDAELIDAFTHNVDVHRRTAARLFGVAPEAVTAEQRGVGKTINFATIYGQGPTALGQILGIARKDAQRYIDEYFALYAGVRAWVERTVAEAHQRGWVETILGRRRYIAELSSKNEMDMQTGERIAANTPIQGSAADLCKLAMLRIARELAEAKLRTRMLLQIHDELVFEAPAAEVERVSALVRAAMETCYPLRVPLVVDLGTGPTWADAH